MTADRLEDGAPVPDEYRNSARGYRAGWNDAIAASRAQAPAEGDAIRSADARDFFERWALTANPDERTNWQVWSAAWTCAVSWASRSAPQPKGTATVKESLRVGPLTRKQIDDIMTQHYPLESLLRESVDAFEACVRDIEKALGVGATQAPAPVDAELTEQQIERAWRLGFNAARDAERLNATEEWGYKAANVIEDVQGLVGVARGIRAHVARQAQAPAVGDAE